MLGRVVTYPLCFELRSSWSANGRAPCGSVEHWPFRSLSTFSCCAGWRTTETP